MLSQKLWEIAELSALYWEFKEMKKPQKVVSCLLIMLRGKNEWDSKGGGGRADKRSDPETYWTLPFAQ